MLALALVMGLLSSFKTAHACSLYLNPETEKAALITKLANYYTLPATAIQPENLTRPAFSFLEGLGADCSGLDHSIITSAFNFTAVRNLQRCTFKGVVIRKAEDTTGEIFVNDENPACVPVISVNIPNIRFPLPLPHHP